MKIAVVSGKGGVGKTTISCGLASMIAHKGKDTVLMDLDPQGNATWGLGADLTSPGSYCMLTKREFNYQTVGENLSVISASQELLSHEIQRLNPESLSDRIQDIGQSSGHWIFDCPPGNEHLEKLAIVAADLALVIVDAHPYAIQGARRVMNELIDRKERGRIGAQKWALVMSRLDKRRSMDRALPKVLEKQFPDVPQLVVHQDTPLSAATIDRTPLMTHTKKCRGIDDLEKIYDWVMSFSNDD
jgi:chromosome partitioning protein